MSGPLPELQVEQSPSEARWLVMLALGMTAFCGLMLIAPDVPWFIRMIGWVGTALCGSCVVMLVHRALRLRGPVLTIDADGIHDVRVSSRPLPWDQVRSFGVWERSGQQVLVLGVDDAVWDQVGVLRLPRATRGVNRALGADGLCFTVQALPISFQELAAAAEAHTTQADHT